jgi:hypothetical protein
LGVIIGAAFFLLPFSRDIAEGFDFMYCNNTNVFIIAGLSLASFGMLAARYKEPQVEHEIDIWEILAKTDEENFDTA